MAVQLTAPDALWQALAAQGAQGAAIDCSHPDVKDLPMCANAPPPQPQGAAPPAPPGPVNTKPTVGIAAHLWAFNRGAYQYTNQDISSDKGSSAYLMRSTAGGLMAFIEMRGARAVLRAEMGIWFPKVERIRPEGLPTSSCLDCKMDVTLAIMMTLKVAFPIGKWVSIYPLLGAGFGAIFSLYKSEDMVDRMGFAFSTGLGLEGFPVAHVAPFFELRYQLVSGYRHEETTLRDVKEWLHFHAVVLALGVRFH
jgi:hypothetical protein